jgi:hypothetical protein
LGTYICRLDHTAKKKGFDAWFKAQLAASIPECPDQPLLNSAGNTNANLAPVQVSYYPGLIQLKMDGSPVLDSNGKSDSHLHAGHHHQCDQSIDGLDLR